MPRIGLAKRTGGLVEDAGRHADMYRALRREVLDRHPPTGRGPATLRCVADVAAALLAYEAPIDRRPIGEAD